MNGGCEATVHCTTRFIESLAVDHVVVNSLSNSQWLQASLPIKLGGLGIRRVSSLALPAFLASAASTCLLQDEILGGL